MADELAAAIPLIEVRPPPPTTEVPAVNLASADRRALPTQGRFYFAVLSTPLELLRVPADALCFEVESELVRELSLRADLTASPLGSPHASSPLPRAAGESWTP